MSDCLNHNTESLADAATQSSTLDTVARKDPADCDCKLVFRFCKSQYETPTWRHPIEFSLSFCSNLFRNCGLYLFLSFCVKYGGLSFTIAYFTMMAFIGLPTVLIIIAIGQQSKYGPLGCWNFSPFMKGLGVSLLIMSALHRAPNLVVASEGIYLTTMLLESMNYVNFAEDEITYKTCDSILLTGFCHERILTNLSQADCEVYNFTEVREDWGVCGEINDSRSTLKSPSHHYLWVRVGVFNLSLALENFAGPKLRTTDLLAGKMRRGIRPEPLLIQSLHWNLVTFVFSLSYCGLLCVMMLEQETVWTLMHACTLCSTACFLLVNFIAAISSGRRNIAAISQGWEQFASTATNTGMVRQPAIWVDALILVMWNTGIMSGELISSAKLNLFGQNFINSCLLEMLVHCLLNGLNAFFVCVMQAHSDNELVHKNLYKNSFGYTHMLMEVHPNTLVEVYRMFSILPLACFAMDELCAFVAFKCCVVNCLVDLWPHLRHWTWLLYLVLFVLFTMLYLPLCMQFGGAVVYDYVCAVWGWNNVLLLAMQLGAFWSYMRVADCVVILFKRLGCEACLLLERRGS